MRSVRRFLERRLKLNEDKSSVAPTNQIAFLGFAFKGDKIRWPDKAFQEKIQQTQEYPWDHKEHPGA